VYGGPTDVVSRDLAIAYILSPIVDYVLQNPAVTCAAENCSPKPDASPLTQPFAASFFYNFRHV
jgi:hypothetical protein